MTGMPRRAIVLAPGMGEGVILEIRSALTLIIPPVRREAGSTALWVAVPNIPFAMCGPMIPTKPRGPQNAVTAQVIRQQLRRALRRIFDGIPPESSVNSSPKSMRSRPLWLNDAIISPAASVPAMIPVSVHVVLEKLPADQL